MVKIPTSNPPDSSIQRFVSLINGLSAAQRDVVKEIGFESMFHVQPISARPLLLSSLAHDYRDDTRTFTIKDTQIQITPQDVACILGVRNEGKIIKIKPIIDTSLYDLYKDPTTGKLTLSSVASSISKSGEIGDDFIRKFSLLVIGTIIAPLPNDMLPSDYISLVGDVSSIRRTNWARFSLEELLNSIRNFQSLRRRMFNINSIVLQVWYCEHVQVHVSEFVYEHCHPLMRNWDNNKLELRDEFARKYSTGYGKLLKTLTCPKLFNEEILDDSRVHESCTGTTQPKKQADAEMSMPLMNFLSDLKSTLCDSIHSLETKMNSIEDRFNKIEVFIEYKMNNIENIIQKEHGEIRDEQRKEHGEGRDEQQKEHGESRDKQQKERVNSPTVADRVKGEACRARKKGPYHRSPFWNPKATEIIRKPKDQRNTAANLLDELSDLEILAVEYVREQVQSSSKKILVRLEDGTHLTAATMECLIIDGCDNNKKWLIDDVMNCYIKGLANKESHRDNTFHCQWLDCLGKETIMAPIRNDKSFRRIASTWRLYLQSEMVFLPINPSACHWYVGVLNLKRKEFQILDSLYSGEGTVIYDNATTSLRRGIQICLDAAMDEFDDNSLKWPGSINIFQWPIKIIEELPRQTDGHSCGIFALKYMQFWDGTKLKSKFSQENMDLFRKKMVYQLIFSDSNLIMKTKDEILNFSQGSCSLA